MNKFDQAFKKYIVEDSEERAWEHRQIQDAAKKAKAMKKKGEKVNFNKLADHYGVSANDIKKACNESYIQPKQGRTFEVGDIVTYEGNEDGWVITGIDGNEYALMEIGEEGVFATLEELQAENP